MTLGRSSPRTSVSNPVPTHQSATKDAISRSPAPVRHERRIDGIDRHERGRELT
jgi:hypothetical protein